MGNLSMDAANKLLENLHHTQQNILFSHQNSFKIPEKSILPILKETCQDIATLIDCERVEIWLFNEERTQLYLEVIYDCRKDATMNVEVIYKDEVPSYFESMLNQRTLAVNDITDSPVMSELYDQLSEDYRHLSSMLDASIVLSWGIGGVLCCLSEDKRHWTPIEKHVTASVADMLGIILDRYHRTKVEEHIYDLAYTDTLTNLDNQHSFYKKVTEKLQTTLKNQQGTFIYIVLDQFSDIQGALGYDAGEVVLTRVSERLKRSFPEPATIARIGFDHFVVFSPILMNDKQSAKNIAHITEAISKPMDVYGQEVYITFSFGISCYPEHVQHAKKGVQAAQIALNDARQKRSRKAQGIYHSDMQGLMTESLLSEMNLRKALDEKQFQLYYQPQVSCNLGEVHGFEALIRWNHPDRGLISPGHFIPLAESTGLIISIGQRVIREAFSQLARWQASGHGHFTLSVNLSPAHFLHEALPAFLEKCAKRSCVSPHKLILEVTENVDFEYHETVKERIMELNEMGFSISIDDFGTGYSAFVYLQHLPIQEIKIDQQFIRGIDRDPKSEAVVKTIIQLGKMLNLKTIAEGVETLEEWNVLKQIGCDDIQGFYFSKPLPIDNINSLINAVPSTGKLHLPIIN